MTQQHIGGLHSVKAALSHSVSEIEKLLIHKGRRDTRLRELQQLASRHGVPVEEVNRGTLNELGGDLLHQGVIAILNVKSTGLRSNLIQFITDRLNQGDAASAPLLLILDEVQDPHNLGACLRSADAAGADAVVITAKNSVGLTPVVRKVASGAAESVPVFQVTNLQRALGELQASGIWIYGAAGEADNQLYDLDLRQPVAIVMGAEGRGLRRLTRERCDSLYHLPMRGQVSSLNVSVAAGISLYEVIRQRT